nr:MAG TPA: hypothetical protein [Caudoviricetes sp.]
MGKNHHLYVLQVKYFHLYPKKRHLLHSSRQQNRRK